MCRLCDAECALTGEMERVILENTNPGHNKQYTVFIELVEDNGTGNVRVMGRWGPIGEKWTRSQEKGRFVAISSARQAVYDLVREKEGRGYKRRICP